MPSITLFADLVSYVGRAVEKCGASTAAHFSRLYRKGPAQSFLVVPALHSPGHFGLSSKAGASLGRSVPPEALRLGESRHPPGYFAANPSAPPFSHSATKGSVPAFALRRP